MRAPFAASLALLAGCTCGTPPSPVPPAADRAPAPPAEPATPTCGRAGLACRRAASLRRRRARVPRSAGPAELGELVTVEVSRWGRSDSDDGSSIEEHASTDLFLCAERRAWDCTRIELRSVASLDCEGSGGCDDPADPGDDPEEGIGPLPAPYRRGWDLAWSIEGGDLVLAPAPGEPITPPGPPPRTGRVPLTSLVFGDPR
jgi:hypothetical protein